MALTLMGEALEGPSIGDLLGFCKTWLGTLMGMRC